MITEEILKAKVKLITSDGAVIGFVAKIDADWIKLVPFAVTDEYKNKLEELEYDPEINIPFKLPIYQNRSTIKAVIVLEKPDKTYDNNKN